MKTKKIKFKSIELFAWAWWLALWLEMAWFEHILVNDFDKYAIDTLKANKNEWNVIWWDIRDISFQEYCNKVDLLTWWFPCQAFSYAWKKLWFEDVRWTLFSEFARAVKETQPKVFLFENVKWLLSHDEWRTFETILKVISDLGYFIFPHKVLNAQNYWVPQKRERVIVVWIKNEYKDKVNFKYPKPYNEILTLKDALKKGKLFDSDVPASDWQKYPEYKKKILSMVPPWGYWRDLPIEIQKEYMQSSFYLWWWKTGIARKISWDEPSLTLTCSPAQKQTERCHPDEIRPFTVREYARIQTFPDNWIFSWSISQQYKQIWNAVPVNLAYNVWKSLLDLLNEINSIT